ncbi:MAG TPA: ATP-binding protein [Actinomycetota bacterium]|nr:ATP-binding protein [Actinomycetota bacterium]
MEIHFSLCLPRDEESVPVVRHICRDALAELGVARDCVGDVELAVTEACTNVLKHAAGTGDEYEVTVAIAEDDCVIRVIDSGTGFDHEAVDRTAEVEQGAESGRGVFLMAALVDDLKFTSKPEVGTVVHLEKKLRLDETSVIRRLQRAKQAAVQAADGVPTV